jgi:cysteine synthase A
MTDPSRIYIGTAFVAGVVLSIAFKDLFYPELEERIREYRTRHRSAKSRQDTSADPLIARLGPPAIVEGIEGCIGNTPLLRIKSLSDATGCEILGKAEVRDLVLNTCSLLESTSNTDPVSQWSRTKLKRPRGFEYD